MTDYEEFLKKKVVIAPSFGIDVENVKLTEKLYLMKLPIII